MDPALYERLSADSSILYAEAQFLCLATRINRYYSCESQFKIDSPIILSLNHLITVLKMPMTHTASSWLHSAACVFNIEIAALEQLQQRLDQSFIQTCEVLSQCRGRIIVTGMGKSGHIGRKIAATLASTGSPAFFVHPGEASHGDLGMITREDAVVAISNSGRTEELLTIMPIIKRMGIPLIVMTGQNTSPLAQLADVCLDISVPEEACPLGLAPTASTTATLVLGDAIAVALLERRGFTIEDFAFSHPAGDLGRKLLLKVEDIMHQGNRIPSVPIGTHVSAALIEMTEKKLGMTAVVNAAGKLCGVYTDGDLRRTLNQQININQALIESVMSKECKTIKPQWLAVEALKLMESHQINGLIVVNDDQHPVGALNTQDLLRAGLL